MGKMGIATNKTDERTNRTTDEQKKGFAFVRTSSVSLLVHSSVPLFQKSESVLTPKT